MELNEMKGIHNLPFGENPFHQNLQNPSLMEKSTLIPISMMKEQQEEDIHQSHHPSNRRRFGHALIFPTNSQLSILSPPNTSSYSNDAVLDHHHHHHHPQELSIIAERKLRRMISNRESARRSRMRKKKQIEELQFQLSQLEGSNRQLSEKLIELLECNQKVVHENAELKHKVSSLQIILTDFLTPLRNLEDVFCSSGRLRPEASNSSHH